MKADISVELEREVMRRADFWIRTHGYVYDSCLRAFLTSHESPKRLSEIEAARAVDDLIAKKLLVEDRETMLRGRLVRVQ